MQILQRIQEKLDKHIQPMFNDIEWTKKGDLQNVFADSEKAKNYEKRLPANMGHSSAQEKRTNGMARTLEGERNVTADMVENV